MAADVDDEGGTGATSSETGRCDHCLDESDPDVYVPRTEYRLLCERSDELERRRAAHIAAVAEIAWLMDNSSGVIGLRLPGDERAMSWPEVRDLYLPLWRGHFRGDARA